jgi:hypothetical protein
LSIVSIDSYFSNLCPTRIPPQNMITITGNVPFVDKNVFLLELSSGHVVVYLQVYANMDITITKKYK